MDHTGATRTGYVWHWFLINGYDNPDGTDDMLVRAVNYSGCQWLDFRTLWDTGYESKGGLVLYNIE